MQFTRTSGPRLIASAWVSATSPPLDAAYASVCGSDIWARVDAIVTTAPFAARNRVSAARVSRNVLVRLVPITRDHSATASCAMGLRIMMPALHTSASARCPCVATPASSARTAVSSATSQATYRPPGRPPPPRSSPAPPTPQPSPARRAAIAAPMPCAPPVTSATRAATSDIVRPRSQIDPRQMPALAGTGVQEHRRATRGTSARVRSAISAATIVAAINRETGRDAIHPAQATFGIAVGLDASGRFAVQCTRQGTMRPFQPVLRRWCVQHHGVESAVHEQGPVSAQPDRRGGHLRHHALAKAGIELRQRGVQRRLAAHRMSGEEACPLQVVIAQQEQSAPLVDQPKHDAQGFIVLGSIVGKVAELHDETIGGGGVREGDGVAVHVAYHADGCVAGNRSGSHVAASLAHRMRALLQRARNVPSAKLNSRSLPSRNTCPPRGNSRAMAASRTSSPPV